MYKNYNIIEVTKDNENKYLKDIAKLEEIVLEKMEKEGKIGQLFITGEQDISSYIHSRLNHVYVATKDDKVISATYITQGQIPFTYNDITKYFKCGEDYQNYLKAKYGDNCIKTMREIYIKKICAFRYARDIIINNFGKVDLFDISEEQKNKIILSLVENEYNDPNNKFHEKSNLRERINYYMSTYLKKDMNEYNDFYWLNFDGLKSAAPNKTKGKIDADIKNGKYDSLVSAYDQILDYQKYKIYDTSHCKDMSKYYEANTANTIELDTYITHPENREKGVARILVFEGIKKSFEDVLKNKNNKKIFLVSTLHQENYSSKYVSEFFGLKDYLFVNRRNGRDRQVHIFGMDREQVPEYLEKMAKKIAVIYDYNPNNIKISDNEKRDILNEQINYEIEELSKLEKAKTIDKHKKYSGVISGKKGKIQRYKSKLEELSKLEKNNEEPEL